MPISKENVLAAIETMKDTSGKRKFKQSVELVVKLKDINLKNPENRLNENIILPNPIGKLVRLAFIAEGDLAVRAKKAGADIVLGRNDLEEMGKNKKAAREFSRSYDHFLAEAPLMPLVGRTLGQVLGPRGKMPTPVVSNVSVEDSISRQRNTVRLRTRDQPVISCLVAMEDMPSEKIAENIQTVISGIEDKVERGFRNVAGIVIKTTMGKPVKIAT